ncbi:hypothetical protein [Nocardia gipuzkoensis]
MTDSNKTTPESPHLLDLRGCPFRDWLGDWVREEALNRIEPTLRHMFEPTFKRLAALLGCEEEPGKPHDK